MQWINPLLILFQGLKSNKNVRQGFEEFCIELTSEDLGEIYINEEGEEENEIANKMVSEENETYTNDEVFDGDETLSNEMAMEREIEEFRGKTRYAPF